jgi:beta-glucanase (GH16 family)
VTLDRETFNTWSRPSFGSANPPAFGRITRTCGIAAAKYVSIRHVDLPPANADAGGMRKVAFQNRLIVLAISIAGAGAACGGSSTGPSPPVPVPATTAWSDEFDGAGNSLPDSSKWTYDLGNNNGWGNRELETYTNSTENVHLDGQGHLIIHVASTPAGYTSARVKTQGIFSAQYGSIEIRAKLPFGQGLWPAFWMLGTTITSVGWPQCGEIDIMEAIGREPSTNHGTLHGPGYSGGSGVTAAYTLPAGQKFADDYHVFAIRWAPQTVTFSVDGNVYATVTPASLRGAPWVFDNRFFLVLNVAVGGTFPGSPDATTQFPQEMTVDYVRVSP